MKNTCLALFLITSISAFGQELPINEKTGKVSYENIIKAEGSSASDLYVLANVWFIKTFNSANASILNNDKESGKIIGKGVISVRIKNIYMGYLAGGFDYTFNFTAKEGRFRYVITDIKHEGKEEYIHSGGIIENEKPECGSMNMSKKTWKNLKAQVHDNLTALSKDFEQHMSNASSEDSDW